MKLRSIFVIAFVIVLPLGIAGVMRVAYPVLPDSLSSPSFQYTIHYDNDNPYAPPPSAGDDLDYIPDLQAQRMLDSANNGNAAAAGNPNGYHTGYVNMGFLAPDFTHANRDLYTYNCTDCDSGDAPADAIRAPATSYVNASERCIRSVIGHELFHHVQFAYITFGKWPQWRMPLEGTARMMQDKIYSDLDSWNAAGCCCGYVGENTGFLANPNRDIWDVSYPSSLFWTYLSEQLGTTKLTEPNAGADFVVTLWQRAQANNDPPDVVKAVRQAIAAYSTNSLETMFQDFTITNYTKLKNLAALSNPQRYRYRDENDGNGLTFGAVPLAWSGGIPQTANLQVNRWGARYLEANVTNCGDGVVGFLASGDPANYAVVAIKGADQVQRILKSNGSAARALLQRSASPYTFLGAVVTGANDNATISYTFDCGAVKMSIREPAYPDPIAYVGAHDDPERFLIKVRVGGPDSLGAPSVEGLQTGDFRAYVGTAVAANEATILSGAYVQGEYWLVAQAPTKPGPVPETYNLVVTLGDIGSAGKESCVRYAERQVDQMLVIDRSGSMSEPAGAPKIDAAKTAAKLYVDSARSVDQTGVVRFDGDTVEPNNDAAVIFNLLPVTTANRTNAKTAINGIVSTGWTSIGDGLYQGYDELVLSGRGRDPLTTERWIVLLSDGMENEAKYWTDVRATLRSNQIKVNTIALGPMTDQPLLQSIAADTGGLYYYVDLPPSGAAGPKALEAGARPTAAPPPLPIQLGNAYALAAERVQNHERLWEERVILGSDATKSVNISIDEGGILDALFTVAWRGGLKQIGVLDPAGNPLVNGAGGVEILSSTNHKTFRVPKLDAGKWVVSLGDGGGGSDVLVILSGINRQGAQLRLFFGRYTSPLAELPNTNQFLVGQPMPILASLVDGKGPVAGALLSADIEHPDGIVDTIPLYDDGSHQDGDANDGLYGGVYYRTTQGSRAHQNDTVYNQRGSYNVLATATGRDNFGSTFTRVSRGSFSIIEPAEQGGGTYDSDKDGLNDLYEKAHSCMDYLKYDSNEDPDRDGLTNLEEFGLGTDPCNPDTDGGGENDFSELKRGANPRNPADDALPAPIDVGVISQVSNDLRPHPPLLPNANLIRYPASAAYSTIQLYRATSAAGPFAWRAGFDAKANQGLYSDKGLVNDIPYYYYLFGVNAAGAASAPSAIFSGTPRSDPFPPIGGVMIAGRPARLASTSVTLYLTLEDVTASGSAGPKASMWMMISNNPLFNDVKWMPYASQISWSLSPAKIPGNAYVFAKFMDAAGNESETYATQTWVMSRGSLGAIRLRVLLDTFLRSALPLNLGNMLAIGASPGVLVTVLNDPSMPQFYTDGFGDVLLENLPPGTYDLLIQMNGYVPLMLEDVNVGAGQTTVLSNQLLSPYRLRLPIISKP